MAELNFSAIPLRKVKKVQFGILGPEEIVSLVMLTKSQTEVPSSPFFSNVHNPFFWYHSFSCSTPETHVGDSA